MKNLLNRIGAGRVIAATIALVCIAYFVMALQLPVGTPRLPGSGFFPIVLALLGIALALLAILFAKPHPVPPSDHAVLWFVLGLAAFGVALEPLGFIPAGIIFTGFLAWLLGAENMRQIIAVALPAPPVMYAIFLYALEIKLPRGLLAGLI